MDYHDRFEWKNVQFIFETRIKNRKKNKEKERIRRVWMRLTAADVVVMDNIVTTLLYVSIEGAITDDSVYSYL